MKPRQSAIPTPGRNVTPGSRSRSASQIGMVPSSSAMDTDYINSAFKDAIKSNDPASHISMSRSVSQPQRSKTPTHARPPSRSSTSSTTTGPFTPELNTPVRIESLGFEGTLRYIGPIDGKQGLWAGVELSGGFAGKGKNDGSVGGKRYFECPEKCGVFVATTKLSAATAGRAPSRATGRPPSSLGNGRPPSSFGGRTTPSFSSSTSTSRMSYGSGRTTPSTGRITPSTSTGGYSPETPAIRAARLRKMGVNAGKTPKANTGTGTRAAKYAGMTAAQLSLAKSTSSPSSSSIPSPTSATTSIPSPTSRLRTISTTSTNNTPKPPTANRFGGIGLGASPATTPTSKSQSQTQRIPSAIAMPPPPLPISRSASTSSTTSTASAPDSPLSKDELDARSKALQERIAGLSSTGSAISPPSSPIRRATITSRTQTASPRRAPSRSGGGVFGGGGSTSRPGSVASRTANGRMSVDPDIAVAQSRIEALEYENERLRVQLAVAPPVTPTPAPDTEKDEEAEKKQLEVEQELVKAKANEETLQKEAEKLRFEFKRLEERKTELDTAYTTLQTTLQSTTSTNETLTSEITSLTNQITTLESQIADLTTQLARVPELQGELEKEKAAKEAVEDKLRKLVVEFEDERRDLREQVDELRVAGQETIALYEEKLRQADLLRYELEDQLSSASSRPNALNASTNLPTTPSAIREPLTPTSPSPFSSLRLPKDKEQTTEEIEAETLHLQLAHLQAKISSLEDSLDDSRASHQADVGALTTRLTKAKETHEVLQRQLSDSTSRVREKEREVAEKSRRVEEVEEALRECQGALEEARAEVEVLRGEVVNANGLASSTSGELQNKLTEVQMRGVELGEEVDRLNALVATQASELDALRKKANRDTPLSPSSPEKQKYDKTELASAREEIMGLKHIIQDLQKTSSADGQRNKVLEAENMLLISEMEGLRAEIKILEDNLDQSILREEENIALSSDTNEGEGVKALKEGRLRADKEIETLRKKIADMEMKHARSVHDLNKEISELEALVEAKIYREDELEQEIERLKAKASKKASKGPDLSSSTTSASIPAPIITSGNGAGVGGAGNGEVVCEICDRPGHDIFTCDLLKEDGPLSAKSMTSSAHRAINGGGVGVSVGGKGTGKEEELDVWCEDCEGHGHTAKECPYGEDVF
ncbi:hypothetical protein VNI00_007092 [Paramarasmius palmivorus]|uniref:CAP-Gly domain-containing protein n=1 Tax=Paramarasmius palmivorus TaxID=297713 RepID=A0AAW0D2T8_9AGAR